MLDTPFRKGDRIRWSKQALSHGLGVRNPDRLGTVITCPHAHSVYVRWDGCKSTTRHHPTFIHLAEEVANA